MDYAKEASRLVAALRERNPRVHCITNDAAQAFTADILLAIGAVPSLTVAPDEVEGFAAASDAVLINLGTLDSGRLKAIERVLGVIRDNELPWVLDPVFVDRSKPRLALASTLLAHSPTAIRGNRRECGALASSSDAIGDLTRGKGGPVVAMTGTSDVVVGGGLNVQIDNGHAFMGQATAIGCALSALVAAFLTLEEPPELSVASAVLVWGICGEVAAKQAWGPGSFRPLLIDAVHAIDATVIADTARIAERDQ